MCTSEHFPLAQFRRPAVLFSAIPNRKNPVLSAYFAESHPERLSPGEQSHSRIATLPNSAASDESWETNSLLDILGRAPKSCVVRKAMRPQFSQICRMFGRTFIALNSSRETQYGQQGFGALSSLGTQMFPRLALGRVQRPILSRPFDNERSVSETHFSGRRSGPRSSCLFQICSPKSCGTPGAGLCRANKSKPPNPT
jgi:hypothetical protein